MLSDQARARELVSRVSLRSRDPLLDEMLGMLSDQARARELASRVSLRPRDPPLDETLGMRSDQTRAHELMSQTGFPGARRLGCVRAEPASSQVGPTSPLGPTFLSLIDLQLERQLTHGFMDWIWANTTTMSTQDSNNVWRQFRCPALTPPFSAPFRHPISLPGLCPTLGL